MKEVQQAVLDDRADLAVHSAKDLPSGNAPGLVLAAVPERADARDALVGAALDAIPTGGRVGTGSVRRRAQLAAARPDLLFGGLRGNIETRLRKLDEEGFDAVVVAYAALERLELAGAGGRGLVAGRDAAAGRARRGSRSSAAPTTGRHARPARRDRRPGGAPRGARRARVPGRARRWLRPPVRCARVGAGRGDHDGRAARIARRARRAAHAGRGCGCRCGRRRGRDRSARRSRRRALLAAEDFVA